METNKYTKLRDIFRNEVKCRNFPSYAEAMEDFFTTNDYNEIDQKLRGSTFDDRMKFLSTFISHESRHYDSSRTSFGFTNHLGQNIEFLDVSKPEAIATLRAFWFLDKVGIGE